MDTTMNNEDAFILTLWDTHRDEIRNYISRRSLPHLVDDMVQDVFLKALSAIRKRGIEHVSHASGWLFRIAHNLIIDQYRRKSQIQEEPFDSEMTSLTTGDWVKESLFNKRTERLTDKNSEPETLIERKITGEMVRHALTRLTVEQERMMTLYLDGYKFDEIGEAMEKTEGAAKALKHRAMLSMVAYVDEGML